MTPNPVSFLVKHRDPTTQDTALVVVNEDFDGSLEVAIFNQDRQPARLRWSDIDQVIKAKLQTISR